jgi:hypothetical protein
MGLFSAWESGIRTRKASAAPTDFQGKPPTRVDIRRQQVHAPLRPDGKRQIKASNGEAEKDFGLTGDFLLVAQRAN